MPPTDTLTLTPTEKTNVNANGYTNKATNVNANGYTNRASVSGQRLYQHPDAATTLNDSRGDRNSEVDLAGPTLLSPSDGARVSGDVTGPGHGTVLPWGRTRASRCAFGGGRHDGRRAVTRPGCASMFRGRMMCGKVAVDATLGRSLSCR